MVCPGKSEGKPSGYDRSSNLERAPTGIVPDCERPSRINSKALVGDSRDELLRSEKAQV